MCIAIKCAQSHTETDKHDYIHGKLELFIFQLYSLWVCKSNELFWPCKNCLGFFRRINTNEYFMSFANVECKELFNFWKCVPLNVTNRQLLNWNIKICGKKGVIYIWFESWYLINFMFISEDFCEIFSHRRNNKKLNRKMFGYAILEIKNFNIVPVLFESTGVIELRLWIWVLDVNWITHEQTLITGRS